MEYKYLSLFLLLTIGVILLLIFAPIIDHIFYIDHKLNKKNNKKILMMIIIHILLLAILVYLFHYYIISRYIKYFKLNKTYIKIMDLILALTLTGLQRNLIFKLRYLSSLHPIRNKLIT